MSSVPSLNTQFNPSQPTVLPSAPPPILSMESAPGEMEPPTQRALPPVPSLARSITTSELHSHTSSISLSRTVTIASSSFARAQSSRSSSPMNSEQDAPQAPIELTAINQKLHNLLETLQSYNVQIKGLTNSIEHYTAQDENPEPFEMLSAQSNSLNQSIQNAKKELDSIVKQFCRQDTKNSFEWSSSKNWGPFECYQKTKEAINHELDQLKLPELPIKYYQNKLSEKELENARLNQRVKELEAQKTTVIVNPKSKECCVVL